MSELKELRKLLLSTYDEAATMPVNTAHHEGYMTGLRVALDAINQKIEEEEQKLDNYYRDNLSAL